MAFNPGSLWVENKVYSRAALSSEAQGPLLSPLRFLKDSRFAVVRLKPYFLARPQPEADFSSYHQRPLVACLVVQLVKNLLAVQETWVWSLGWEDPQKKEMATHSSILAWRIPWTEEPGGLQSMGSQRVVHDWATNTYFCPLPLAATPWPSLQDQQEEFFLLPTESYMTSCMTVTIPPSCP